MPKSLSPKKPRIGPLDLSQAVWNHDVEQVHRLLKNGADPNHIPGGRSHLAGMTPLLRAIDCTVFETSDANRQLQEAAAELSLKLVQVNPQAERKSLIEIIQLLISFGADINKLSPSRSPLNWAADRGDIEIVKLLLKAGADPAGISHSIASKLSCRIGRKFVEGFYGTALHAAAKKGHCEIVQALTDAGADLTRTDHQGKTPAQVAATAGHKDVARFLRTLVKS